MAYALGELGQRVLIIDLDPQGSLSKLMLKESDTIKYMTMFDVHTRNLDIKEVLFDDETYHVSLLPSNERNARLINLISEQDKLFLLKNMIAPLEDEFDWIILDSVPSINELSKVVLSTSNMTVIPFMPKKLVFDQLASTVRTVQKVKKFYNPELVIKGILPVAMNASLKADKEYYEAMEAIANEEALEILPMIKRSTFIEKAADSGKSVIQYRSKESKVLAEPFRVLAKQVVEQAGETS
jgi:chromosome partitioning protein